MLITRNELKKILRYHRDTGTFTWRIQPPHNKNIQVGQIAGYYDKEKKTHIIEINTAIYRSKHLVWLFFHGYLPTDGVYHINGDHTDTRIENLQLYPITQPDNTPLTLAKLKELLHYDPETGVFTRKVTRSLNNAVQDKIIICAEGAYIGVTINQKRYKGQNLAWLYMTGSFPKHIVDHIDRNPSNNKWLNLREAAHQENMFNRKKHSNNKSGYKGVYWHKTKKKWRARCVAYKKQYDLGLFDDKEHAAKAYENFAKEKHGEFFTLG